MWFSCGLCGCRSGRCGLAVVCVVVDLVDGGEGTGSVFPVGAGGTQIHPAEVPGWGDRHPWPHRHAAAQLRETALCRWVTR